MAKLITAAIRAKLEKNYQRTEEGYQKIGVEEGEENDVVLKLFGGSACTWLITEIEPDNDTLWGLCDLGMGCCEFGTVSLRELETTRFPPFGLGVERDRWFKGGSVKSFQDYYDEHNTLNGC